MTFQAHLDFGARLLVAGFVQQMLRAQYQRLQHSIDSIDLISE